MLGEMRMNMHLCINVLCCALLTACAWTGGHPDATSGHASSGSLLTASGDVVKAADRLVAEKRLSWGEPVEVKWQREHNRYLVIYATPEKERLMGGDRGVFVETDGRAWLVPQL
jgi:hypothetical protein